MIKDYIGRTYIEVIGMNDLDKAIMDCYKSMLNVSGLSKLLRKKIGIEDGVEIGYIRDDHGQITHYGHH